MDTQTIINICLDVFMSQITQFAAPTHRRNRLLQVLLLSDALLDPYGVARNRLTVLLPKAILASTRLKIELTVWKQAC